MLDELMEYSIRANHQNLLDDNRYVLAHETLGPRKSDRVMRRLASIVRRRRLPAATPVAALRNQLSSDAVTG